MIKKFVLKLTLIAFCLTYFHQVFDHIGSVHHEDAIFASNDIHHHKDLFANEQGRHFESAHDDSDSHESGVHNHITELKPKNISKYIRKTLVKYAQAIYLNIGHQAQLDKHSKYVLMNGGSTKTGSSIPLYLCAQSFLI